MGWLRAFCALSSRTINPAVKSNSKGHVLLVLRAWGETTWANKAVNITRNLCGTVNLFENMEQQTYGLVAGILCTVLSYH